VYHYNHTERSSLERLARDSQRLNHKLGLVWVKASQGLFARLNKDYATAIDLIREWMVSPR
jgi:hypothetical protein